MLRRTLTWLAPLAATACNTGLDAPRDPYLLTDRAVYRLEELSGGHHRIEVILTYTNRRSMPVYLARLCGSSDQPWRILARAANSGERIRFIESANACNMVPTPRRPPIEIAPGGTYQERVDLTSQGWNARPPLTMEQITGTFYFEYVVLATAEAEGPALLNALLPESERVSNAFTVLAP